MLPDIGALIAEIFRHSVQLPFLERCSPPFSLGHRIFRTFRVLGAVLCVGSASILRVRRPYDVTAAQVCRTLVGPSKSSGKFLPSTS